VDETQTAKTLVGSFVPAGHQRIEVARCAVEMSRCASREDRGNNLRVVGARGRQMELSPHAQDGVKVLLGQVETDGCDEQRSIRSVEVKLRDKPRNEVGEPTVSYSGPLRYPGGPRSVDDVHEVVRPELDLGVFRAVMLKLTP